ncbi:disulfide bond formation protein B [Ideonella sp. A 288]|uniref:disulfide bond formation protein B n=1 Tax=Ideonella sp. A 288 TaxID=1962181 RepID=UPI000B4B776F|nr:disulfide bond formation protein B [Ideonella sp. A 288]
MTLARTDLLLGGTVVVALGAVGAALVSQHVHDMQPCPWCVLQRLIFLLLAAGALVGLLWRSPLGRRVGAGLALLFANCGIAAALWQHFVAAASASCNLTFADKLMSATGLDGLLPQVFAAYASCADAKVSMAGVPYEFFSLALFLVLGWAMLKVLRQPA